MAGQLYDVVVIGAGIEGSATAYHLAREGRKVLLLEQFPLPHTRGSSHGQSRIIRKAYTEEYYARMMPEAYAKWHELEKESGLTLFKQCGLLVVGKHSCAGVNNTTDSLQSLGCEHERLDGHEMCRRYPGLKFPNDFSAVFEPGAGILKADLALKAYQSQFVACGGVLKDSSPVLGVRPGLVAYVTTTSTVYRTKSVVITAGPWTDRLIKPLGLTPPLQPVAVTVNYWKHQRPGYSLDEGFPNVIIQYDDFHSYSLPADEYPGHVKPKAITVAYWKEKQAGTYHVDNGFPSVALFDVSESDKSCGHYTIPGFEYPGLMKVCFHSGPNIDPDRRDESKEDRDQALLRTLIRKHYPGLEDTPSIVEKCIYTMTPDENFILDTHPRFRNIVVGAGFSGHGFKLAPVVGKILGELATGKPPSYNLTPFKINRFLKTEPQSKL